jgi:NADH:ubiquinone oxidoreductase subunit E
MGDQETPVQGNPGFAGETGEFEQLSEADIRGSAYVGSRPADGGHPGAACSLPYQVVGRDADAPLFEGAYRERLDKILSRYPTPQGALLPVLALAQEIRGYVGADSMAQVAEVLGLSPTYVRGVATFYTMYNKKPVGDYLIQVCTNVSCNLCGGDDVMQAFLDATGTEAGELTDDGVFTVIEAECLGACGFPTAVQVNERYFENVAPADAAAIVERLRGERAGAAPVRRFPGHDETEPVHGAPHPVPVPADPGEPGAAVGPEANPYSRQDPTPPAPARPPASDRPASGGQD